MSNASEMAEEIMSAIQARLKAGELNYRDLFGALRITELFFEVEYTRRVMRAYAEAEKEDAELDVKSK